MLDGVSAGVSAGVSEEVSDSGDRSSVFEAWAASRTSATTKTMHFIERDNGDGEIQGGTRVFGPAHTLSEALRPSSICMLDTGGS